MAEPVVPTKQPQWADTGVIVEPSTPYKSAGWTAVKPPLGFFNWWMNLVYQWTTYLVTKMSLFTGYAADTTLTMTSGGVITPTQGNHAVDTFGAASSQDLKNILTTNLGSGRLLVLTVANASHAVVVKNAAGGAGQIHTADGQDMTLTAATTIITLKSNGTDWYEVSRSAQLTSALRITMISSTGSYTPLKTTIKVRQWGGGAGGGGGGGAFGGSGGTGGNGGDGGDTWLGSSSQKSRGGKGGNGGQASDSGGTGGGGGAAQTPIFSSTSAQSGSQVATTGGLRSAGQGGLGGSSPEVPFQFSVAPRAGGSSGTSGGAPGGAGVAGTAKTGTGGSGGGGAGDGGGNGGGGGGGGSNGEYSEWILSVTPGVALTATIGAGGTAGTAGAAGGGATAGGAGAVGGAGLIIIEE